jgi:PAS domain S-box-containing protein
MSKPTVKQFMSQVLLACADNMPLVEAAKFLTSHKLTTIPVTGSDGSVIGVLSDFHLLRGLIRSRQETNLRFLADIKDEMDPVVTVSEGDSIVQAFSLMIQSPNHRIYVLKDGKLVGAVSPKDLLLQVAGITTKDDPAADTLVQRQIESILKELHDTRRLLTDYQQMFQDSPYLMHSVDMSGKIVAANRMIHFVLGYEEGELLGRTLRQLYPPDNYLQALEGLDTVKKLGFHPLVSVTMLKKDGDLVRVDIASSARKGENGQPDGTITVGRLSDSYRMLNYLQRAASAASKK